MAQKIYPRSAILSMLLLAACVDRSGSSANGSESQRQIAEARTPSQRTSAPDGKPIVDAIKAHLGEDSLVGDDVRFATAWSDLNGDGRDEVIVRVTDPAICGSGGCNIYVLSGDDRRWEVIDKLTVTQLPIYQLASGDDGWAELGVTVSGGGVASMVMAVPHGPSGYADNPTVAPARPIDPKRAKLLLAD